MLERPQDFCEHDIPESTYSVLDLSSAPKIIGVQFLLKEMDLLFRVNATHLCSDGFQFSVQYEGIRCVLNGFLIRNLFTAHNREPDVVDLKELKRMLQNSKRVS